MTTPRAAPIPRLPVCEPERKFGYLKLFLKLTDEEIERYGINTITELRESGYIKTDSAIAKLIGIPHAATVTNITKGREGIPADAAARLLEWIGLDNVPEAIWHEEDPRANDKHGNRAEQERHSFCRRLLLAPLEEFLVMMRNEGAVLAADSGSMGAPWAELLRRGQRYGKGLAGSLTLKNLSASEPKKPRMGAMRGIPVRVENPHPPAKEGDVFIEDLIYYQVDLGRFSPKNNEPVYLWGIHVGSGADPKTPLHVPFLPSPWHDDELDGALERAGSLCLEIPDSPSISTKRCIMVPDGWGAVREVVLVVSLEPMEDDLLRSCKAFDTVSQETLDLLATRLLARSEGSWMLLRTAYPVKPTRRPIKSA